MKRIWNFLVSLCLIATTVAFMSVPASASTSLVGTQINTQAPGWLRINDDNSKIVYSSGWPYTSSPTDPNFGAGNWNNDAHYTTTTGSTATFKFYGTEVRIIGTYATNGATDAKITVDGTIYPFSQSSTTTTKQVDSFELTNLPLGVHSVVLTEGTNGYLVLDAIDLDSTGSIVASNSSFSLQASNASTGINLTWTAPSGATSYNVERSTTQGGPYTTVASSVTGTTYTDSSVSSGTTYYYVVTANTSTQESAISNEVSITTIDDNALLTITLINGDTQEFDIPMSQVNAFINWYNLRSNGTGPGSFAINKGKNNKGPFKSRTSYEIYDKILTFEVDEYTPSP